MRQVNALRSAKRLVGVEGEGLSLDERDAVVLEHVDPQLRSLEVGQNGDGTLVLRLDGANHGDAFAQLFARQMAHVEAEDVGARLEQFGDHFGIFGSRSQRGQNFRAPSASHFIAPLGGSFL